MSEIRKNSYDQHRSRRKFLKGLAAGIGLIALPDKDASASLW